MEEAMKELLSMDNKTTYPKAKAAIDRYRVQNPGQTEFANVSKKNLLKFLENPEMVALRMYFATNEKNENTLVFVGIDASGENILNTKPTMAAKSSGPAIDGGTEDDVDDDSLMNEFQLYPPPPKPNNNL